MIGKPKFWADKDTIAFDTTYTYHGDSIVLRFANAGTADLTVTKIYNRDSNFIVNANTGTFGLGEVWYAKVKFSPMSDGLISDTIYIESNDPEKPVYKIPMSGFGITKDPPVATISTRAINIVQRYSGAPGQTSFKIKNVGDDTLAFSIENIGERSSVSINGQGSDNSSGFYGYKWIDSDEPTGPKFEWIDISKSGTKITTSYYNQYEYVYLDSFNIDYYGRNYNYLYIHKFGYVSFNSYNYSYNRYIPSSSNPDNIIAPFWDGLSNDNNTTSGVYYQIIDNKLVVQYHQMSNNTFQVIIHENGDIVFQYLKMDGYLGSASVGIEDYYGYNGIGLNYNSTGFIKNNLAVLFKKKQLIEVIEPSQATLAADEELEIKINYDLTGLNQQTLKQEYLRVTTNEVLSNIHDILFSGYVTGTPNLGFVGEYESFDFGSMFIEDTSVLYLTFRNYGNDTLKVSPSNPVSSKFWTPDTTYAAFRYQYQGHKIPIYFSSDMKGGYSDSITFETNDPNTPRFSVSLLGNAMGFPVAIVAPDSVHFETKFGVTKRKSILISNVKGESALKYSLRVRKNYSDSSFEDSAAQLANFSNKGVLEGVKIGYYANRYDYDNWFSALRAEGASVNSVSRYNIAQSDIDVLFIDDRISDFYDHDLRNLITWINEGGQLILTTFDYDYETFELLSQAGFQGRSSSRSLYNIENFDRHPINEGINKVRDGYSYLQMTDLNENGQAHVYDRNGELVSVLGKIGRGSVYFSCISLFNDYSYYSVDNEKLAQNVVDYLLGGSREFTFSSDEGVIAAGQKEFITIDYTPSTFSKDTLFWNLYVENNSREDEVIIPITSKVTGAPLFTTSEEDTISFGEVLVGLPNGKSLTLFNEGVVPLTISNITSSSASFTLETISFPLVIGADSSVSINITFDPQVVRDYSAKLSIESDDPNSPNRTLSLIGKGGESQLFSVELSGMSDSVFVGENKSSQLLIRNDGTDTVRYSLMIGHQRSTSIADLVEKAIVMSGVREGEVELKLEDLDSSIVLRRESDVASMHQTRGAKSNRHIAILAADYSYNISDVTSYLTDNGAFASVTELNIRSYTPNLDDLRLFDAVLVWSNNSYSNSYVLGDVLFEYVQEGGGVVQAMYSSSNCSGSGGLGGKWYSNKMNLLASCSHTITYGSSMVKTDPNHEVLSGVKRFDGNYYTRRPYSYGTINDGVSIAEWSSGHPLVVVKETQAYKRVDFGFYPPSSRVDHDYWQFDSSGVQLVVNALNWVSHFNIGSESSWLSANKYEGKIAPNNSDSLTLKSMSSEFSEGRYGETLTFRTNDSRPNERIQNWPFSLSVYGIPDVIIPDTLSFIGAAVGQTVSSEQIILNLGTGTANFDSAIIDGEFLVQSLPSKILPGASQNLSIGFRPTQIGESTGWVYFYYEGQVDSTFLIGKALAPGKIGIAPDSINIALHVGDQVTTSFYIKNENDGVLDFYFEDYRNGFDNYDSLNGRYMGWDRYGYQYIDSRHPDQMVNFEWTDITSSGTTLSLEDDDFESISIPFEFDLYGERFDELFVSSNGFVSVSERLANSPNNRRLSSSGAPFGMISPMWTDLDPTSGSIYYQTFNDTLIVQFVDQKVIETGERASFQVMLTSSGNVRFNYLSVPDITDLTVGIESFNGVYSLEVAHDEQYLEDSVSIKFNAPSKVISPSSTQGTIAGGDSLLVTLQVDASNLTGGDYIEALTIVSNDTINGEFYLPINLDVTGYPEIDLTMDTLQFDTIAVHKEQFKKFHIWNYGSDILTIDSLSSSSGNFVVLSNELSIVYSDTTQYAPLESSLSLKVGYGAYYLDGSLYTSSQIKSIDHIGIYQGDSLVLTIRNGYSASDSTFFDYYTIDADRIKPNVLANAGYKLRVIYLNSAYEARSVDFVMDNGVQVRSRQNESVFAVFNPQVEGKLEDEIVFHNNSEKKATLKVFGTAYPQSQLFIVSPASASHTLNVGDSATGKFIIENTSDKLMSYQLRLLSTNSKQVLPKPDEDSAYNSSNLGLEISALQPEATRNANRASRFSGTFYAEVYDGSNYQLGTFDLSDPETYREMATRTYQGVVAAVLSKDKKSIFGVTTYGSIIVRDLAKGNDKYMGFLRPSIGSSSWTGMARDPLTKTLYASTRTDLFIVNEQSLSLKHIGTMNYGADIQGMAIDNKGRIYVINDYYDAIYTVDGNTAQVDYFGELGYNASGRDCKVNSV